MKINYLKINGFGKIKNQEVNLNKNINIIYGKNERGKSTLLKFISGMFYGLSKNKNGKEISDFEKYIPWESEEYSGKITYELNDKNTYEVFRDFRKKNPQIYNENSEDISKNFSIDKTRGNEFFFEQTGIDEDSFCSTALIGQKEVILDTGTRRNIVQKISNIMTTGEENISYKKTIDKLNKKLIEEVGTERTIGRPLNIIQEKLNEVENKIKKIKDEEENKIEIKNNIQKIKTEIEENKNKINVLLEIKKIKEENNFEEEQIKIKNNLIEENKNKINNLENKINKNKIDENKINKKTIIIFIILFIINLLIVFLKTAKTVKIISSVILIFYFIFNLIIYFIQLNKNKTKNNIINNLNNEKNAIEKITLDLNNDINKINNEFNLKNDKIKIEIIEKNKNNFEEKIILNYFDNNLIFINNELKTYEEKNNNLNFQKYQLELEEKNINNNILEKINLEEQFRMLQSEEKELLNLKKAIELTKEVLEKSYNKMKDQITPKFAENLSKNTQGIIEAKYKNIKFNEKEGLTVEIENGKYINANLLSVGTIDQLYLALRLSVLEEIAKEDMPIILDETFAYYDDERLENILKYLSENYKNHQIIILTCSAREKQQMDKLNLEYNYIEL